jgi:carbon-monoxide dehydrogenase large subunit
VHRGMGIACLVEPTTYGSAFYRAAGIPGSGHEAAWVRVDPSGAVVASVGIAPAGQGHQTTMAQAVAEGLGLRPEAVAVRLGDTEVGPCSRRSPPPTATTRSSALSSRTPPT